MIVHWPSRGEGGEGREGEGLADGTSLMTCLKPSRWVMFFSADSVWNALTEERGVEERRGEASGRNSEVKGDRRGSGRSCSHCQLTICCLDLQRLHHDALLARERNFFL
jgi:hypothetical protein